MGMGIGMGKVCKAPSAICIVIENGDKSTGQKPEGEQGQKVLYR